MRGEALVCTGCFNYMLSPPPSIYENHLLSKFYVLFGLQRIYKKLPESLFVK